MYSGIGMIKKDGAAGSRGLEAIMKSGGPNQLSGVKSVASKKGMTLQHSVNELGDGIYNRVGPTLNDQLKSMNMPSSTRVKSGS